MWVTLEQNTLIQKENLAKFLFWERGYAYLGQDGDQENLPLGACIGLAFMHYVWSPEIQNNALCLSGSYQGFALPSDDQLVLHCLPMVYFVLCVYQEANGLQWTFPERLVKSQY